MSDSYKDPILSQLNGIIEENNQSKGDQNNEENSFYPKYNLTDLGNSKRFVSMHGKNIRFNQTNGKWYIWNEKQFEEDKIEQIYHLAEITVRKIYKEGGEPDDLDVRKKIVGHALKSEGEKYINAMVKMSGRAKGISVTSDHFNLNPYLLNLHNGIYDFSNNTFIQHSQDYNLSYIARVEYNPEAKCLQWDKFLEKVFNKDQKMISFIARCVGISLTGITDEQRLFFCYGTGANGKTTFFKVMELLAGNYFQKAPTEMLLYKRNNSGIPNDIARLQGARFVVASELPSGRRLNEQVIKDLTGGDRITARFLHKEYFEFNPTHKLWMYGNHMPHIKDTDEGIWRRIVKIPFTVRIPENERQPMSEILNQLQAELSGILNWAIFGYLDYRKNGLDLPDIVEKATNEYKYDSDILGEFLNEKCLEKCHYSITLKDLYNSYIEWCNENNIHHIPKPIFRNMIIEHGFTKRNGTNNRVEFVGIGLKNDNYRNN